jgi:hypothetical protein
MTAGRFSHVGGVHGRPNCRERMKCHASKIHGGKSSFHFRFVLPIDQLHESQILLTLFDGFVVAFRS